MTREEARRRDLYNAAIRVFGDVNADTFMALLPANEGTDLATKDDILLVGGRIDGVNDRFDRLEARLDQRFDAVNQRFDRLFLTLAGGLIAMIATVFAQALL